MINLWTIILEIIKLGHLLKVTLFCVRTFEWTSQNHVTSQILEFSKQCQTPIQCKIQTKGSKLISYFIKYCVRTLHFAFVIIHSQWVNQSNHSSINTNHSINFIYSYHSNLSIVKIKHFNLSKIMFNSCQFSALNDLKCVKEP